jgi:hypothetical protein
MQLPGAVRKTFIVMGAAVQVLGGCGSPPANRADVEGTVTLGGMPLDQGSIMFVPAEGTRGLVAGGPIDGGRYRLTGKAGVAIGRDVVEISAPERFSAMAPGRRLSKRSSNGSPRGSIRTRR